MTLKISRKTNALIAEHINNLIVGAELSEKYRVLGELERSGRWYCNMQRAASELRKLGLRIDNVGEPSEHAGGRDKPPPIAATPDTNIKTS